jgi:multiple RNA-binding domain-containing protein 1
LTSIANSKKFFFQGLNHLSLSLPLFPLNRDAPLYLEWAPENILSQTKATIAQEETNDLPAVGEKLAKKVMLDQSLGIVDEEEIDLDRVEVCLFSLKKHNYYFHGYNYLKIFYIKLHPLVEPSANITLHFLYWIYQQQQSL